MILLLLACGGVSFAPETERCELPYTEQEVTVWTYAPSIDVLVPGCAAPVNVTGAPSWLLIIPGPIGLDLLMDPAAAPADTVLTITGAAGDRATITVHLREFSS